MNRFIEGSMVLFFVLVAIMPHEDCYAAEPKAKFVLSGGLGVGSLDYKQVVKYYDITDRTKYTRNPSLNIDIKIGVDYMGMRAILINKISFFKMTNYFNEDVVIASGITGPGVMLCFSKEDPVSFVYCGYGFLYWDAPFENNTVAWNGGGWIFGAGKKITESFSIDLGGFRGNVDIENLGIIESSNAISSLNLIMSYSFF